MNDPIHKDHKETSAVKAQRTGQLAKSFVLRKLSSDTMLKHLTQKPIGNEWTCPPIS